MNGSEIQPHLNGTSTLLSVHRYHVTVGLPEGLPTPERGQRLLNLERVLRDKVDRRIEVFLQPRGDINKLRVQLRGVKV